ncbi:MAG: hypothetical protein QFX38_06955 [Methanothermobacter sp.]|nr:hypothetical protein [Methanothermobacter sp.]
MTYYLCVNNCYSHILRNPRHNLGISFTKIRRLLIENLIEKASHDELTLDEL